MNRTTAGFARYPRAASVADIIETEATRVGLPPALVMGLVAVESGFDARAYRPEPHIGDASYGLMQLLSGTARGLGYTGAPSGLYDPAVNAFYGVQFLADGVRQWDGDVWAAVSRYNNGSGKRAAVDTTVCLERRADGTCKVPYLARAGTFLNQPYVDKVRAAAASFGSIEGESGDGSFATLGLLVAGTYLAFRKFR